MIPHIKLKLLMKMNTAWVTFLSAQWQLIGFHISQIIEVFP